MATFAVGSIVAILAVLAVGSIIRDKKRGKSISCGGDCSKCGGGCRK